MPSIEDTLARLSRSSFRTKFHLSKADREYIAQKGIDTIRTHCEAFVAERLAPASISNDGKRTGIPFLKHSTPAPAAAEDA